MSCFEFFVNFSCFQVLGLFHAMFFPLHIIRFIHVTCLCFTAALHHQSPPLVFSFLVSPVTVSDPYHLTTVHVVRLVCTRSYSQTLFHSSSHVLFCQFSGLKLSFCNPAQPRFCLCVNKSSFLYNYLYECCVPLVTDSQIDLNLPSLCLHNFVKRLYAQCLQMHMHVTSVHTGCIFQKVHSIL